MPYGKFHPKPPPLNTSNLVAAIPWSGSRRTKAGRLSTFFRFQFGDIPAAGLTGDLSSWHISGSATDDCMSMTQPKLAVLL